MNSALVPGYLFGGLVAAVLGTIIGQFHLSSTEKIILTGLQAVGSLSGSWLARLIVKRVGGLVSYRMSLTLTVVTLGAVYWGANFYWCFGVFSVGMGAMNLALNTLALQSGAARLNALIALYSLGLACSPLSSVWLGGATPHLYCLLLAALGALPFIASIGVADTSGIGSDGHKAPFRFEVTTRLTGLLLYQTADALILRFAMGYFGHIKHATPLVSALVFSSYVFGLTIGRSCASTSTAITGMHKRHGDWISLVCVGLTCLLVTQCGVTSIIVSLFLGFLCGPMYVAFISATTDLNEQLFLQAAGTSAPLFCTILIVLFKGESVILLTPVLWTISFVISRANQTQRIGLNES